jgi:hypothetical protein
MLGRSISLMAMLSLLRESSEGRTPSRRWMRRSSTAAGCVPHEDRTIPGTERPLCRRRPGDLAMSQSGRMLPAGGSQASGKSVRGRRSDAGGCEAFRKGRSTGIRRSRRVGPASPPWHAVVTERRDCGRELALRAAPVTSKLQTPLDCWRGEPARQSVGRVDRKCE